MPKSEPIALVAFAALCVIGIIILGALHTAIPGILGDLALVGVSGGAGAALPTRTIVTPTP